jgi:hypothetical protein
MLVISRAQWKGFRSAARARFELKMTKHLALRSPFHARVLGDAGMRAAVHFGIERAEARGYTLRGPVRLWLELMFLFGGYFDDDPLLPSAAAPLVVCKDPDRQMPLAEQLHTLACDVLTRISGPGNVHNRNALARLQQLVSSPWTLNVNGLEDQLLSAYAWAHPQKFAVLGEVPHRRLIKAAIGEAHALGVRTPNGIALFPVLAFIVGAGFARDPLYPWISRTLDDPTPIAPDERAARLEQRARIYLRHALANLHIT